MSAHVCVFHRGARQRDALLRDFFGAGVAAGDKCLCIAETPDLPAADTALRAAVGGTVAPGQLTVLGTDAYLTDGRFRPDRCVAQWDDLLAGYVAEGFPGIRAAADVSWVLRHGVGRQPLLEYEARCNRLNRHPATIYCLYDLDRFGPSLVSDLLARHTGAVAEGVLVSAPRPEAVTGPGSRPWRAGPGPGQQFLVLAQLLLAGAAGEEEIGELVAQVCAACVDVDLAAVASPDGAGRWTARGLLDGVPLSAPFAARIARAASRSEPPPSGGGSEGVGRGPRVGLPATVLYPVAQGGTILGWLVAGSRDAAALDVASPSLAALAVLAAPHLGAARLAGERRLALARVAELEHLLATLPSGGDGDDPAGLTRRLLDGDGNGAGMLERVRAFGVDPNGGARVVVVRLDGTGPAAVRATLAGRGVHLVTSRAGEVAFLVADDPDLDGLVAAAAGGGQAAGVGRPTGAVDDIPRSYDDARQAAALAASLGRPALRYDDLGLFRLLAAGGDTHHMEELAEEWLGALAAHDRSRARGGDLVSTLAAYLDAGANQLATAEALGIHVSTLKYRLRRIEEVSGRSLSDPDHRFHLQVALHVRRALEVLSDKSRH